MILSFFLLQAAPAAEAAPETAATSLSLLELAIKGGWLMLVLLVLSILAVYIFGERLWAIRKATKTDPHFMNRIKEYIYEGRIDNALDLCRQQDNATGRLIEKGLSSLGHPLPDIRAAIENKGSVEVAQLEQGLPVLATISGGAPMIGFLGTVIGMVQAFYNMSVAGSNIDISLLSGGIYTAMVTTVAGLIVGIPAYFGYNYLNARINSVVHQLENDTLDFLDLLQEPVK